MDQEQQRDYAEEAENARMMREEPAGPEPTAEPGFYVFSPDRRMPIGLLRTGDQTRSDAPDRRAMLAAVGGLIDRLRSAGINVQGDDIPEATDEHGRPLHTGWHTIASVGNTSGKLTWPESHLELGVWVYVLEGCPGCAAAPQCEECNTHDERPHLSEPVVTGQVSTLVHWRQPVRVDPWSVDEQSWGAISPAAAAGLAAMRRGDRDGVRAAGEALRAEVDALEAHMEAAAGNSGPGQPVASAR